MATETTASGALPPVALPAFKSPPSRRDPTDPPLTPVPASNAPTPPSGPQAGPSDPSDPPSPSGPLSSLRSRLSGSQTPSGDSDGAPLGSTSTEPRPRRRPGGDPVVVAQTLAGLVVVVVGFLAVRLYGRGLVLREPTPAELDEITKPIGRIAVRYLPMDALNPDLLDATQAVAATHKYVRRGPLVTPRTDDYQPPED